MHDTNTYKTKLEAQLQELLKELSLVGIHDPTNPQNWIAIPDGVDAHEADTDVTADVVEDWDERQALMATLETRYNDITRALEKIATGVYGVCELCGLPIEPDRLDANPAARTDKTHMDDEGSLPL